MRPIACLLAALIASTLLFTNSLDAAVVKSKTVIKNGGGAFVGANAFVPGVAVAKTKVVSRNGALGLGVFGGRRGGGGVQINNNFGAAGFVPTGFVPNSGVRFNSFGSRTLTDFGGNVFEQDFSGNTIFRGSRFRGFSVSPGVYGAAFVPTSTAAFYSTTSVPIVTTSNFFSVGGICP